MTSRAWDSYGTYLFDIDGTLLRCDDAVHYFGFCKTLTTIAGRTLRLDGVVTQGNVDVGILRDALALADVPESAWRPHLSEMRDELCQYVEDHHADFRIEVLPGVRRVLAHLREQGASIGVATGNLERIGWAKLAACDLKPWFDFGGFSDLCESRAQVFAGALAQARGLPPGTSVCVLGDTPADVQAACENGIDVIAVASGAHSSKDLEAAKPDRLVSSLVELFVS